MRVFSKVTGALLTTSQDSLLLVTHVAIREGANGRLIDDQTAAGIEQWCRYFDRVTYFGIADAAKENASSAAWVSIAETSAAGRCDLKALPRAYGIASMARSFRDVRNALREAVASHRHLCFTLGTLIGDWPAVAAQEAVRQGRGYSAWFDTVQPSVFANKLEKVSGAKRLIGSAMVPLIERGNRYLLQHSSVALLQGRDTFAYYARWASDPHCTYDTHTHVSDQISPQDLAQKMARVRSGAPIKIVYVGRAAAMKGTTDWLDVLDRLRAAGVPFEATWVGDGPELEVMRARCAGSPLGQHVNLPGFEGDRQAILRRMREADLMLFCHKTAESPRCLIESLVCGCPIVGYETPYPVGLAEAHGGGAFVPKDNVPALADLLGQLHMDRERLAQLIAAAAESGRGYNEDAVYAHRAELMRRPPYKVV